MVAWAPMEVEVRYSSGSCDNARMKPSKSTRQDPRCMQRRICRRICQINGEKKDVRSEVIEFVACVERPKWLTTYDVAISLIHPCACFAWHMNCALLRYLRKKRQSQLTGISFWSVMIPCFRNCPRKSWMSALPVRNTSAK